jgi:hypothetical protein
MKKKVRSPRLPWLIILVGLVAVGFIAYMITVDRTQEEKKKEHVRAPDTAVMPGDKDSMAPVEMIQRPQRPREKLTLPEEPTKKERSAQEEYCGEIEKSFRELFAYLSQEAHIQDQATDIDIYDRFKTILAKLSSQPPIPAGEGMDSLTMIENVYHFYRVLDEEEIRLIRQILKDEADSIETDLRTLYEWLMPTRPCPNVEGTRPSLDVLYPYAGYFLNTIGGNAYLFRRSTPVRLLVSYYSVLILHAADKKGENTYGIDVFPEITRLAKEISAYPGFQLQNTYIQQLTELQNDYLETR